MFDGVGLAGFKSSVIRVGLNCSFFLTPTFSFSSFNGLVISGCGLRTDSVLILSQPCIADTLILLLLIIIIIIIITYLKIILKQCMRIIALDELLRNESLCILYYNF